MELPVRSLIANMSPMLLSGAAQFFIAFVGNLILVRYLSPADFGKFSYTLALATVAAILLNFRIGDYIARSSKKELIENLDAVANITLFQALTTSLISAIVLYVNGLLDLSGSLLVATLLISPFVSLNMSLYERNYNYNSIAKIEISANIISHVLAIMCALASLGILALYIRMFSLTVMVLIGIYVSNGISLLKYRFPNTSEFKSIFTVSKWNWLDGTLEQSIDRIVILGSKMFMSFAELGFFYQARRLTTIPHQLLSPATTRVFLRHSADMAVSSKLSFLLTTIILEILVLGFLYYLFYLFGENLVVMLFGQKWMQLYIIVLALAGVLLTTSPYNTLKAHYISCDHVKQFVLYGRIPFISVLVSAAILMYTIDFSLPAPIMIAVSLSCAYTISTIVLILNSIYLNKSTNQ